MSVLYVHLHNMVVFYLVTVSFDQAQHTHSKDIILFTAFVVARWPRSLHPVPCGGPVWTDLCIGACHWSLRSLLTSVPLVTEAIVRGQ